MGDPHDLRSSVLVRPRLQNRGERHIVLAEDLGHLGKYSRAVLDEQAHVVLGDKIAYLANGKLLPARAADDVETSALDVACDLDDIADDRARATPLPHDAITDAGTEGKRAGLADTFKAFFVALEESSRRNHGFLPNAFELTDQSMASLLSCALGLGPEKIVDSTYVKRLRQRQRERARQA